MTFLSATSLNRTQLDEVSQECSLFPFEKADNFFARDNYFSLHSFNIQLQRPHIHIQKANQCYDEAQTLLKKQRTTNNTCSTWTSYTRITAAVALGD